MRKDQIRKLAISLLDDDCGINESAMEKLAWMLHEYDSEDIVRATKATEGRYYLQLTNGQLADLRVSR